MWSYIRWADSKLAQWLERNWPEELNAAAWTTTTTFQYAMAELAGTAFSISSHVLDAIRLDAYRERLHQKVIRCRLAEVAALGMLLTFTPYAAPLLRHAYSSAFEWWPEFSANPAISVFRSTPPDEGLFSDVSYVGFLLLFATILLEVASPRHRFKIPPDRPGYSSVPYACALVAIFCAAAKQNIPSRKKEHLKRVDLAVSRLAEELLKNSGDRALFPRRSPRTKAARDHAALVAAAVHRASLQIDVSPEAAFTELGNMAMRICEAYVDCRWGRLLEESELTGLVPERSREPLRLAIAGCLTIAIGVAGAFLGVPDGALPMLFGLVGLISFTLLMGRTPRSLELLDAMRGVQRP
ncbi:hypothetical protein AB0D59_47380 [Streptomyces sp. NPDC048417]|uniref:hypothetical protein n=1 Tax=Streptomyces sp. NPDC048417 TaxID=3155387 RepID=UPI0034207C8A